MRYGFCVISRNHNEDLLHVTFTESEEETYEKEGKDILEKRDIESFPLSKFNQNNR